jgi:hypothetical protein
MTLEEFIATPPESYGVDNVNLLYSSSLSGSENVPVPPYTIIGMTFPFTNGVTSALKEVNEFVFNFGGSTVNTIITGKQTRDSYMYITVDPVSVSNLPIGRTLATDLPLEEESEFVFTPYVTVNFNNNDYNPLQNNSEGSKLNVVAQVIDRDSSQITPTNISAIISGTAAAAEIQNCSYTKVGLIRGRYNGSKTTASPTATQQAYNKQDFTAKVVATAIVGDEPALAFKDFNGSLHAAGADATAIKALSEREVIKIFFNSEISGSHPNKTYPDFPYDGSILFTEEDKRYIKIVNSKVYSVDRDKVFTTTEFGIVSSIE